MTNNHNATNNTIDTWILIKEEFTLLYPPQDNEFNTFCLARYTNNICFVISAINRGSIVKMHYSSDA